MYLILLFVSVKGFAQKENYISIVSMLPKNYVKDASVDYTSIIQKAITGFDSILMPDFPILINDNGIKVGSNKIIVFQHSSKLILAPSNKSKFSLFYIENAKNVKIFNAHIVGDRNFHQGNKGEWGMGIRIEGSTNVLIDNATISDFWGDGIYITRSGKVNSSKVTILNSTFNKNRRNGISIISGAEIRISNSLFSNTNGTNPMAGIDIEPNSPMDNLGLIEINNIRTSQNRIGVQVSMMHFPSNKKQIFQINIENMVSLKEEHGLLLRDFYNKNKYGEKALPLNGIVTYKNIEINESLKEPIKYFNNAKGYEYGPKYIFNNIRIRNNNSSIKKVEHLKTELGKRGFDVIEF